MNNIPEIVLWFIGFMIVANLGAIGSMVMAGFKITWWASSMDSRLTSVEDDVRQDRVTLDEHRDQLQTLNGKLIHRRS